MKFEDEHTGLVGLFEFVHEYVMAEKLLNSVIAWLRDKGCNIAFGPVDFSI